MKLPMFITLAFLLPIISPALSNTSSGGISWWCSQVPYPETCNYYLNSIHQKSSTIDRSRFIYLSLRVTIEHTIDSLNQIKLLGPKCVNEKEKVAWSDCLELYDNTIILLNQTILPRNITSAANDKQVNLCGVRTNLETCQNGFIELNVTDNILPLIANNASKLISNVLAVNIQDSETENQSYQVKFPSWLSTRDRLLLKASSPPPNFVVAQDGTGNFRTINEALAASFNRTNTARFVIYIKQGTYREYLNITIIMQNIMLLGDGLKNTIITGDRSFNKGFTTFNSATVVVYGKGFIARGITFRNTAGPQNHQAVALRSDADFSVFYRCGFVGYQDTLYVHSHRQFYRDCSIYGTIDFIFGDAAVVLQNCKIFARRPMAGQQNSITAQDRLDPRCPTGIIVHNSRVMASADLAPVQNLVKTYLGRPWGKYSRTVFIKTFIDSLVDPAGWSEWNGSFALNTLFYGEHQNFGPGSSTSRRVKWLGYHVITNPVEASKFTVANFINGQSWLPATNVPFIAGL